MKIWKIPALASDAITVLPYKTFPGSRGNKAEETFKLWAGLDYAGIIADVGIPTADGFVSFALS